MTNRDKLHRQLPYRAPLTIALALLSFAFFGLGLRGIIAPDAGAVSLGKATIESSDLWLMQTTAARNIGVSVLAMALIYLDHRRSVGALLVAATMISALDFLIISNAAGFTNALKHTVYLVVLGFFSWITLRKHV